MNQTCVGDLLPKEFDSLEFVLDDAVSDHKNDDLKNFYKIKQRLGWFSDYVDAPCANPAGAGPGAGF